MDDIKDIVNKVIGDMAGKKPDTHDKTGRIWQNLLTKQELKHTKLVGMNQGTLWVNVDSPAWLYQMKIRQTKLVKQLKEELPDIQGVRFKIGTTA